MKNKQKKSLGILLLAITTLCIVFSLIYFYQNKWHKKIDLSINNVTTSALTGKYMDEEDAGNLAIEMLVNSGATKIAPLCLSSSLESKEDGIILFSIRELHNKFYCKGNPKTSPIAGRVKVDTLTGKTYIYDVISDQFKLLKLDTFPAKYSKETCSLLTDKSPVQNFQEDAMLEKVSGYCPIQVWAGVNLLFSFENISSGSKESNFILNIYNSDKILLQTLPIEYSWEITSLTANLHDDINFDGYKDLLLRVFGARSSQFTYTIYNPDTHLFEADDTLTSIFLPTFDPKNKTISSTADTPNYYFDDHGHQKYYTADEQTTVYVFDGKKYRW